MPATPWRLFGVHLCNFVQHELYQPWSIVIHEQVLFIFKIPDKYWPEMSFKNVNVFSRVNDSFHSSQSSNTIHIPRPLNLSCVQSEDKWHLSRDCIFPRSSFRQRNTVVCTQCNLTFIGKYHFSAVLVDGLTFLLFAPLNLSGFFLFISLTTTFFFRWASVWGLHSFNFAVISCKLSPLIVLTRRFKVFLVSVNFFFLPLRFKFSTEPALR